MNATAEVRALAGDPLGDAPLGDVLSDELQRRFLVWDAFVSGRRRVDLHPLVLPASMHRAAVHAAEHAVRIVDRVAARAFDDPIEAARYGFDEEVLRLARASHRTGDRAALTRVDLLLDERGAFRACEINADCPGGLNEASALPHLARRAGFRDGRDPTHVVAALVERLAILAREADGRQGAVALVYATAYAEDLQLCAFVQRALQARGIEAVLTAPTSLVMHDGVLHAAGVPVRAIYRFFPAEYMPGMKSVHDLARAIESGAVRTMSSFAHMFAQSKLSMARATALSGGGAIAPFPETHPLRDLPRDELLAQRADWVIKRALGRVGDQVFVGALMTDDDFRMLIDHVRALDERSGPWIAQRYIRQRPIATPFGARFLTLGAYVLDGRFVGYFARITRETHVSHDALCVPVFVAREEEA
jgi:glutathionylspermidine synthase